MNKLPFFLLLLALTQTVAAQIKVSKLDSAAIPVFIKYKGVLDTAVRYTDKDGDHIMIASVDYREDTVEMVGTASDGKKDSTYTGASGDRTGCMYAYNYLVTGKTAKLLWQMRDFTDPCGEDVTAEFLTGTFAVTDIDHNGIAVVWLMYKINCAGDVSPVTMKIIMHEGAKKYAVRGSSKVVINGRNYGGGSYTFDEAFNKAPEAFKDHARLLWKKHLMERFQQQ